MKNNFNYDNNFDKNKRKFLKDKLGRKIEYLRVSLTDRCNFRCLYCMPAKGVKLISHNEILRFEEIENIVKYLSYMGLKYVRLTGGEPLIRKNLELLIKKLNKIENLKEITITTNGYFLEKKAIDLKKSGIKRLNISLDTLNREKFYRISRIDGLEKVLKGIFKAIELGFHPIKINTVLLKDFNTDEIDSLIEFAYRHNLHIRFIELMPSSIKGFDYKKYFYSIEKLKSKLGKYLKPLNSKTAGPSKDFIYDNRVKIGFINAISHSFCNECNRLRLTADGKLKPCLMSDLYVDLKPALRPDFDPEIFKSLVEKTLLIKPASYNLNSIINSMHKIGG